MKSVCETNMMSISGKDIGTVALEHFPRLIRLRKRLLDARPAICVERARLFTEYFLSNGFDKAKPVMRQANALAYTLDNIPTPIFEDELIVGSTTRHRLGVPLFPEFTGMTIFPELPTINRRDHDPVSIEDSEIDLLANKIFPFWRDINVHEYVRREGNNPFSFQVFERLVFYINSKSNGISHIIPDYSSVVHRGLQHIIDEAAIHESKAGCSDAVEFYRAVQVSLKAVIRLALRYSQACRDRASEEAPSRRDELLEIAAFLERVPARPAATLHEALQAVWITQTALHQENTNAALSFGRLDQYLYPLYKNDVANGIIDDMRACELIGSFFVKMGDHTILTPRAAHKLLGGASTDQAITLGGMKPDGSDGVNELTFVMLKAMELLSLREPNVGARWHISTDPQYMSALIKTIHRTGAAPALYNDEEVTAALTQNAVSLEDARDYGIVGCVETISAGRTMGMTGAILFNLASVLELTLNDGIHPQSGTRIGPKTGALSRFSSYDEFIEAFKEQLGHLAGLAVDGNNRFAEAHAILHPTPLLSSLIEGTFASGKDVTRGGAKYNSSGVAIVGLADVTDSLSALKHLVFSPRPLVTPDELSAALKNNYNGYDRARSLLLNKAPKYGTDDPAADRIAASLVELIHGVFTRYQNPRSGRYHVGYWSMTMHAGVFAYVGALPNGRLKGTPLASGATPVSGVAVKGPTASLASTSALNSAYMANCIANNHKFSRSMFAQPGKIVLFEKLVESYFRMGGMQVQFNIHDKQTLLDARDNPDNYRDLLVRVSGYSAYFCDLSRQMQDEIIDRTEDVI